MTIWARNGFDLDHGLVCCAPRLIGWPRKKPIKTLTAKGSLRMAA